ncbi:MAG TPA: DNA-binding protein [Leeuwenhoekiella sp.]|nr:DNA-binding protein [Leeuwenhoekiella sp.]HAX16969.1 DNA-binding protein [Leeuwenhoekiella sp.]HBO30433.1 DNA-binding protein [Leeuwenhoekiella sp.]HCQ75789.1 DNA-binding protein [Leeuwenhoekiella sp.]|tara:strand:+ start:2115 stop:2474 length:360 start_codon:yes stop_codon:yes gene_type:complete
MSSNIRLKSICEYCGNEFIAKTLTTRYCSHKCNSRDYKARKKKQRINEASQVKNNQNHSKRLDVINSKDFLTVQDVSQIIGCSTRTVYRLIDNGTIKAVNLSERLIRINRRSLEQVIPM